MLTILEDLLNRFSSQDNGGELSQQDLNIATAALLVEVATIDQHLDETEWNRLQQLLISHCKLEGTDAQQLAEEGKKASANSASLYDFTQLINRHCDHEQKFILVKSLWEIAFADGSVDKYEEHIIRRIADLIHVSHRDFIQAKIEVREKQ